MISALCFAVYALVAWGCFAARLNALRSRRQAALFALLWPLLVIVLLPGAVIALGYLISGYWDWARTGRRT